MTKKINIHGSVAPGFESMKALFRSEMNTKAEEKAQLCVYYQGEKVVDLWASKSNDNDFTADSLVNVFSSGKSLETLAIASLVDQGLLQYHDKIADHWPEFAAKGKGDITVADLMRHEAGLENFKYTFDPEQLLKENIKQNSVGSVIEGVNAKIPSDPRKRRNYHALTRGWVVNELFRRVDPKGRTLGEYLQDEIAQPLGADVNIGVSAEDLDRRAPVKGLNFGFYVRESFKPKLMGRKVTHSATEMAAIFGPIFLQAGKAIHRSNKKRKKANLSPTTSTPTGKKPSGPFKDLSIKRDREKMVNFFNQAIIAQGESASFNANCSARGLAKVAAMMAGHGNLGGKEYFSESAWQSLHAHADPKSLGGTVTTHFTQGGLNLFTMNGSKNNTRDRSLNKGREGFYGWMGLGGSIFQWNPEENIGFAFVPTSMHMMDLFNERGKVYQEEALRCVKTIRKNQGASQPMIRRLLGGDRNPILSLFS